MPTAIDLFAGLGEWSTGARNARVEVIWAANHCRSPSNGTAPTTRMPSTSAKTCIRRIGRRFPRTT